MDDDSRSSGWGTNPARVADGEPETGTLRRAVHVPPAACVFVRAGRPGWLPRRVGRDVRELGVEPTNTYLLRWTTRAVVGGRGVESEAVEVMNACASLNSSFAFVRFSLPIVEE